MPSWPSRRASSSASLSSRADDAHKELLDKVRGEVTHEAATIIRDSEQRVRAECHKTAQEIISLAIQRCAADHTAEVTVTSVHIPSDDLKGRINRP